MGLLSFTVSRETEERRRKAIPSQVFFNHFIAISYHLRHHTEKYNLKAISFYNDLKIRNDNFDMDVIRKLLWNSWSTEYAYSLASQVDNPDYYKFALHWNFPQAYYSIYLTMTAFHETQGIANKQHEKSIKLFGNSIKDGHYPKAISFFCKGLFEEFEYCGLDSFNEIPTDFSVLSGINSLSDAQIQIASFLKSTREKNAKSKREKVRDSDTRFHTQKGRPRKTFSKSHWDLIYKTIPETSILNMMYRLRIKANYNDIETFIHADIDFRQFHQCLKSIISYMNLIHESYIVKVIGREEYEQILNDFPSHLGEETAVKRYNKRIIQL